MVGKPVHSTLQFCSMSPYHLSLRVVFGDKLRPMNRMCKLVFTRFVFGVRLVIVVVKVCFRTGSTVASCMFECQV